MRGGSRLYRIAEQTAVEPDWLLIYQQTKTELILIRTGSHSDLFN
ncbi:MAG: hypothetical protein F6K47_26140 [Symploca sp. SIO2E6]|nr:hypothetical protein [Symploca sp. SIO2E6]